MLFKIVFQSFALLHLTSFVMSSKSLIESVGNSAGSLNECGEVDNVNDTAGDNWDYKFHCPSGYECVNKECRNEAGTIVKSVVDRCSTKSNKCEQNIDLTARCGLAFTRSDNQTYYFNCAGAGANCNWRITQCTVYKFHLPAIITRCNYPDLWVNGGQCQGKCPMDVRCEQIIP